MLETAMQNIIDAFDLLQGEIAGGQLALRKAGSEAFRSGTAQESGQWAERLTLLERCAAKSEALRKEALACLRPLAETASPESEETPASTGANAGADSPHTATLIMTYDGVRAWAAEDGSGIVLLKGSTVKRETWDSLDKSKTLARLRRETVRDGTLIATSDARVLGLTRELRFRSLSAAACFVAGCSVSGPREWRPVAAWRTDGRPVGHPGLMN